LIIGVREAEKWCFQFSKFQRHFTADFKAESPLAIWNNFQSKIPLRCGCALLQVDIADFLRCDMMAFDYSGFGVSTGHSNEETIYENIDAVYRYMIKELGILEKEVILIGFSMGTAAVIDLAAKRQNVCLKHQPSLQ
uniref:AB hydrolase-1 domain-containing protein n=1 Tax=Toxocara canis TaxID=6265 RepID=A0A183VHH3_TOXCA